VPLFWRKAARAGPPALAPPDQAFLLREIVDGVPDPAAILDGRGQIAAANAALGTLFSRKQCEGRTLLELSRSAELADAAELDGDARGFVEMIARHADRLARLTRDLLDLSRLEAGQYRPETGPIDVGPFCEAALDLVRARAAEKQIVLGYDGPASLRMVADGARWSRSSSTCSTTRSSSLRMAGTSPSSLTAPASSRSSP